MRGDDQLSHWLVEVVGSGGASAASSRGGRAGARGGKDAAGEAAGLTVAVEEAKSERSSRVLIILVHIATGVEPRGSASHGAESPDAAAEGQRVEVEEAVKWALLKPLQLAVQQQQLRAVMHVELSHSRERGLADVAHRFQATRLYIGPVKRSLLWSRLAALSLTSHSARHTSPPSLLSALPPSCLLIEARGVNRLSTHYHPLLASAAQPALSLSRSLPQGARSARSLRGARSFLGSARRIVGRQSFADGGGGEGEDRGKWRRAKSGILEARGRAEWEGGAAGEAEGQARGHPGQSAGRAWGGVWSGAWQHGRGTWSGSLEAEVGRRGAGRIGGGELSAAEAVEAEGRGCSGGECADDACGGQQNGRSEEHGHSRRDGSRERERGHTPQQRHQQPHAHPSWLPERRGSGSFMPTWSLGLRTRGSGPLAAVRSGDEQCDVAHVGSRSGMLGVLGSGGVGSVGGSERECDSERERERDGGHARDERGVERSERRYSRRWRHGRGKSQSGPLGSASLPSPHPSNPTPPSLSASTPATALGLLAPYSAHAAALAAAAPAPACSAHGSIAPAGPQGRRGEAVSAGGAEEAACSGGRAAREMFPAADSIKEGRDGEEGEGGEDAERAEGMGSRESVGGSGSVLRSASHKQVHTHSLLLADAHSLTPPAWAMSLFRSSSVPGPSSLSRPSPSFLPSSFSVSSSASFRHAPSFVFARASSVPGSTRAVKAPRHTHGKQPGRRRSEGKSRRGVGGGVRGERGGMVPVPGNAGGEEAGRRSREEAGGTAVVRGEECGVGEAAEVSAGSDALERSASVPFPPFPPSLSSSSSSSSARLLSLFRPSCTLSATPTSPVSPALTASPGMPGRRGGRAYEVVPLDWLQEVEERRARMTGARGDERNRGGARECEGRGSLDSHLMRGAAASPHATAPGAGSSTGGGYGGVPCIHTAAAPPAAAAAASGVSVAGVCGQLCTTACVPGYTDQCSCNCASTPSLTPTPLTPITPATATTATAPISLPSTDSPPSNASSPSFPEAPPLFASASHIPHLPPHLTIIAPYSTTSATTTPTPGFTPSFPSSSSTGTCTGTPLTTPGSLHQWRRRRRRESARRDDSDVVRRMNASMAYLSTRHSQLVHLGGPEDDDEDLGDGLDVDDLVVGGRLEAGGDLGLAGGMEMGDGMGGGGWEGEWETGERPEGVEGDGGEGQGEGENGWVECMAGDASFAYGRFSGPINHGIPTFKAAAAGVSPSCALTAFHHSPCRAAAGYTRSLGTTPAAFSPACLSPHPSPCRSSSHGSPSASHPRIPCSLSQGPCEYPGGVGIGGGSGVGEGRRRSMLGLSRSMGVATLTHALSSLSHAPSALGGSASGSASGSPAAGRSASRLMVCSGPTAEAHYTHGATAMGIGTGMGMAMGVSADAHVPSLLATSLPVRGSMGIDGDGDGEEDMGLDIDILLSDLRSRQMRSASGSFVTHTACPALPGAEAAVGVVAGGEVAAVEAGEEDRRRALCDVRVDAWRGAAESDSGDRSLAACS